MVNQPITISATSITGHLIVVLYYNSAPLAEVQRITIAPGDLDISNNFMFVNVNPGAATVRWYESDDGTALTSLIGTFQLNISEKRAVFEARWYKVGGTQTDGEGNIIDPAPDQRELTDPYLDGKVVTEMTRRGVGELQEGIEWVRTDNTITLLNPENQLPDGPVFVADDVFILLLSYLQEIVVQAPQTRVYYGDITEDITLTSEHRNKINYINGLNPRLTITAEELATIPDGDWYGFSTNGGNQLQVTFKVQAGDAININGEDKSFVVFGKMENWKIFKRGSRFDVETGLQYLHDICRFFKSHKRAEINGLWCDGSQYSGDDYPRPFYEIKNMQDSINSATVITGKEGCFYWWEDGGEKYFRTPNRQNAFSRNLKDFDALGSDSDRAYDYPGGSQPGKTGKHRHLIVVPSGVTSSQFPEQRGSDPSASNSLREYWNKSGGGAEGYYFDSSNSEPSASRTSEVGEGISEEGYPPNQGDFEFIKI